MLKGTGQTIDSIVDGELCDGKILASLLSQIGDERVSVNQNPKQRIQKIENCNKCLLQIKKKITVQNLGAEDIVDNNQKLLLGLLWTIILRFAISDMGVEGKTAREGLLLWCQRRLEKYNLKVENFTTAWADGRAYAALLHSHAPEVLDYDEVKKLSDKDRTNLVFDLAQKNFQIDKLLDQEDVNQQTGPEEKSNMTYISQYFHAFSEKTKIQMAQRRCGKFQDSYNAVYEMRHDYEQRTTLLKEKIEQKQQEFSLEVNDSKYQSLVQRRQKVNDFKSKQKKQMVTEKNDLVTLYSNIQTKARTFGFKEYTAPKELSVEQVNNYWLEMLLKERSYLELIRSRAREIKQKAQDDFSLSSMKFADCLKDILNRFANLSGPLDDQLMESEKCLLDTKKLMEQLPEIEKKYLLCTEAAVDDTEHTSQSYEDLTYEATLLSTNLEDKIKFIQNQIALSKVSNVTAAHCAYYETTFVQFDKDKNNALNPHEFKAALASLNVNIHDEDLEETFKKVCGQKPEVTLAEFVSYMKTFEEDQSSRAQVLDAFRALSLGPSLTPIQLQHNGYSLEQANDLVSHMPKNSDGSYDYEAFVDNVYLD